MTEGSPELKPSWHHVKAYVPMSAVLDTLLKDAPEDYVTLEGLMAGLHERSFGIVILLLGLVGLIPGISAPAGILLSILAFQMMMGRPHPAFPRPISSRRLQTRQLARLLMRAVRVLKYLERLIHPRWRTPFEATQRVVGFVILLLSAILLLPVPLSNLPPALVILLISLALIEEDGVLLAAALLGAVILLSVTSVAIWEAVRATLQMGS
jgi:hypothetical protein